ncbi:MAG: helix-turn-helix transcriptional regulator [Ruminococcus sp.]|nr:helix-turn-helix transcriptional regulator [Ruminococcus sp.]
MPTASAKSAALPINSQHFAVVIFIAALCAALNCQPGEILEYVPDENN